MTNETFEKYIYICDALNEHRGRVVLEIIIDAQYNDLMQQKSENDANHRDTGRYNRESG